jgi:hypothetical protein
LHQRRDGDRVGRPPPVVIHIKGCSP